MKIFKQLLSLLNKISGGVLFKKNDRVLSSETIQPVDSNTWKVDWIDQNGEKGTYDTQLTDLEEAEWKFKYMFDDHMTILKIHKGRMPNNK